MIPAPDITSWPRLSRVRHSGDLLGLTRRCYALVSYTPLVIVSVAILSAFFSIISSGSEAAFETVLVLSVILPLFVLFCTQTWMTAPYYITLDSFIEKPELANVWWEKLARIPPRRLVRGRDQPGWPVLRDVSMPILRALITLAATVHWIYVKMIFARRCLCRTIADTHDSDDMVDLEGR